MRVKGGKWYIIRVKGNSEKTITERLIKYSTDGELKGKLIEVLAPMKVDFTVRNGKKVKRENALYPGYVFLKTNSAPELKSFFRSMEGVSGFISDRHKEPAVLTEKEVNRMIGNNEIEINKEAPFIVGEAVTIIEGPFNTFKGKIESIDGVKIKVDVKIFGRVTPVDLSMEQIVKDY